MNPTVPLVVVATACAAVTSGCGSSTSAAPTPATALASAGAPSAAAAAPTPPDACVVGAWKASFSMTVFPDDATRVNLSGGAGEVLTLNSDGSFLEDLGGVRPLIGSADGHQYSLTGSGSAAGHFTTRGGMITYTYDEGWRLVITLTKDGTANPVVQPPIAQTDSYSCTHGASLSTVASGGGSTQYVPSS
jgi:hypothetical protein